MNLKRVIVITAFFISAILASGCDSPFAKCFVTDEYGVVKSISEKGDGYSVLAEFPAHYCGFYTTKNFSIGDTITFVKK